MTEIVKTKAFCKEKFGLVFDAAGGHNGDDVDICCEVCGTNFDWAVKGEDIVITVDEDMEVCSDSLCCGDCEEGSQSEEDDTSDDE